MTRRKAKRSPAPADTEHKTVPSAKPKRRAQDLDQCFDQHVPPCDCHGSSMRFELETHCLVEEHDSDFPSAAMVVSWRYRMTFREVMHYFASLENLRWPQ